MIAVWVSCGAASVAALAKTLERYPDEDVRAVYNPIAEEDEDNHRFLADVEQWLGVSVERAFAPAWPKGSAVEVWEKRKAMSFPLGAPCTTHLKKEARYAWEKRHGPDWHVLGFTVEEKARHDRFVLTERENVLPVLIEAGMTKGDCADFIRWHGLTLPRVYGLGYPNGNCIGCVKSTSPTYWNLVRETHPDVFRQRADQSRALGAKLVRVKNRRIYLDELDPSAKGRPLKTLPDCGLFCEER